MIGLSDALGLMASTRRLGLGSLAALALLGATVVACGDSGGGTGGQGGTTGLGGQAGTGGSGEGAGTPVKVLNWNLHNFFDTVEDPSSSEQDSISQTEYQSKLAAAAAVIAKYDPDVLVLQEIENETVLSDLDAALGGKYAEQDIVEGRDPRGIDIAGLSKIPFSKVVHHLEDSFPVEGTVAPEYQFTRDLVEYHFDVGAQEVALLGVHYKAKGTPASPDNPDKRLAEAQRSRAVADELAAATPTIAVVILGDFNDTPGSAPLDAVTGSNPLFVDAADSVPEADRWTFDFMGTKELIDHQMMNPTAASALDAASVTIDHGADTGDASDHAPIIATYVFR